MVTERDARRADGLLITRNIDYSVPYRVLLSGRGLHIPYLGERLLDALAGLLVRLHLAGFYWGDCSLSNTLFRRDAGALDRVHHRRGDRRAPSDPVGRTTRLDLTIAIENVAGDLEDLQAGGLLADGIDPDLHRAGHRDDVPTAVDRADRHRRVRRQRDLPHRPPAATTARSRLRRSRARAVHHSRRIEAPADPASRRARLPRAAAEGAHRSRDRREPSTASAERHQQVPRGDRTPNAPEGSRDRRCSALARRTVRTDHRRRATGPGRQARNPPSCTTRCLEHLWFMSEAAGGDVGLGEAVTSYVRDVLTPLPTSSGRPRPGGTEVGTTRVDHRRRSWVAEAARIRPRTVCRARDSGDEVRESLAPVESCRESTSSRRFCWALSARLLALLDPAVVRNVRPQRRRRTGRRPQPDREAAETLAAAGRRTLRPATNSDSS